MINSVDFLKSKLKNDEAFLIISPVNRRYLTDFDSSDGYFLITANNAVFLTDSRYIEAARQRAKNCDDIILLKKCFEQLNGLIRQLNIRQIYIEENISVCEMKGLEKNLEASVKAEKTDELLTGLRRTKSEEEKKKIIKAQRIAENAFDNILKFIKPGVTEREIRIELEYYMLKNGSENPSFETIAISGKNTSMPHGVPTDKRVENGDFITMDYGAVFEGYHSDMTRTVAVGSVSGKMAEVYNTVLKAQLACIEALKPGVSCKDGDAAARGIIEKAGYGDFFGHGTGHGVGLEIHEAPNLSPKSRQILSIGDIVTDEPGIYIPGEFGVRIEDMIYITETGCENLTNCEKSIIIL